MFDEADLETIREARRDWEDSVVDPLVSSYGERREEFRTDTEGIDVDRLYTPADIAETSYLEDIGFPGQEPFTRGVYGTMYRGRYWTMRQYAGFGTAAETNDRFRYLLDEGQTGLSLAFDLPTQMGHDSDDPLARGEVGKSGVAIDSLADMETVFDEIPLDTVSTSMTINAPAAVLLAMYVAVGDQQGIDRSELRGTVQNDILKEYIARNTYIYPPEPSMRLATDIIEFCAEELESFNAISISGYHIREEGATAAQEIAFTLADGIAYVEAARDSGLDVESFAPTLSFFFSADNNLLEEVAKFRAARRLWASIMEDRFGVSDPQAKQLKFHTQTGGSTLTAQQPENNIVRVAYQALAAVLGGTQSLHTNGKDEAIGIPTEASVKTALRTQQILAHETGVADTIDPLAGSYYVESLTDDLEGNARDLIDTIDDLGGMVSAVEDGWVKRQIEEVAYERERQKDEGERIIVGVNAFESDEEPDIEGQSVSQADQQAQIDRLQSRRDNRDPVAVEKALDEVRSTAESNANLMPTLITAVKTGATVGEICDVLREVFGEHRG